MTLDHTLADPAARDAHLADALRGLFVGDPRRGPLAGGRAEALRRLHGYDPARYGRTRNFVDAPVSRLSAYLRHGMVTALEVRDRLRATVTDPGLIEEFLRQLAWRDFFHHVLAWHGAGLDDDLEEPKHGVRRLPVLPPDVDQGRTGLPCVDGWLHKLFDGGYLHNHERLWFAAYLCHWRGVHWSQGARLFYQHLYDGDRASNTCSWQWVEGTFASKPYFMNKQNIAHYSGGEFCRDCRVKCPFDAGYDDLQRRLFGGNLPPLASREGGTAAPQTPPVTTGGVAALPRVGTAAWVHDAALSPGLVPAAEAAVFVFDAPRLAAEPWAFHRLAFVFDGVCELFRGLPHPTKVVAVGDPVQVFRAVGAAEVRATDHPDPAVRGPLAELKAAVSPRPVLAEYRGEPRRFTRYWEAVAPQVLGYKPARRGPMR
jgi:deoxyribodipyrimidine photo-lyase